MPWQMSENSIDWLKKFGEHLLSNAVMLLIAYFGFIADKQQDNTDQLQTAYSRIEVLENRVDGLQKQRSDFQVENARLSFQVGLLKSQIANGGAAPSDIIFDFIDSLGVPGWCKIVEDAPSSQDGVRFVMAHINARYEIEYNITSERYVGLTDFDIGLSDAVANNWYLNDLQVYKYRRFTDFTELVELEDGPSRRRFWKLYHSPEGIDTEFLCGWEIMQ